MKPRYPLDVLRNLPRKPSKNAAPWLLDWIRGNVVDRKLGIAYSTTRQAYTKALSEFVKHSRYAIDQWAGRIDRTLQLGEDESVKDAPPAIPHSDLLLIARQKAPELDEDILDDIANEALGHKNSANAVHSLLSLTCWNARKDGRKNPTSADAQAAIQEWKLQPAHDEFENASGPPKIRQKPAPLKPSAATPPKRGSLPAATMPGTRADTGNEGILPSRNRLSATTEPALAER
jgi:hypothetical protein